MQILHGFSVSVVVQALSQFAQQFEIVCRKVQVGGCGKRGFRQVVPEGGDHRPRPVLPAQVTIDDQAGADRRCGVDVRV